MGEPQTVFADLRRLNPVIAGEDSGFLLFAYDSGVRALFDGNRLLDHAAENTRHTMGEALLEGTRGVIRLDGDGRLGHRAHASREETIMLEPRAWAGFGGDSVHALQQHVVRGLLNDEKIENTAAEYLVNLCWEELAYCSASRGQVVAWSELIDPDFLKDIE